MIDFSTILERIENDDYHQNNERLKMNKSINIVIFNQMRINNSHNKTLYILLLMYIDIKSNL